MLYCNILYLYQINIDNTSTWNERLRLSNLNSCCSLGDALELPSLVSSWSSQAPSLPQKRTARHIQGMELLNSHEQP